MEDQASGPGPSIKTSSDFRETSSSGVPVNGSLGEQTPGKTTTSHKKKKKKDRRAAGVAGDTAEDNSLAAQTNAGGVGFGSAEMLELQRAVQMIQLGNKPPKTAQDAISRPFEFWSTQPVPKLNEEITINQNEAIEANVPIDTIRQEPYSLPDSFIWDTLDLEDPIILKELYSLLSENYVEDDDCLFRFDYPSDFLKWALKPPGWKLEWHCGVRVAKNRKLVGFISAIPANVNIHSKNIQIVEINFLCVHKKLRSKRVAPVLIREITRRVNLHGIFQAVYTAGVVLPKPISTCRYWHRSLNPKKLIETRFSHLTRNMTLQRTVKLYRLPMETKSKFLRPLTRADIPSALKLLTTYLNKFKLGPVFNQEEFEHWFLPRKSIVDTYVVEREGVVTDMISFYSLPSTVVNNPMHKLIKAAYSFYNVASSMSLQELMHDALVLAKNDGFDVFNALDLMDNKEFLEPLKFGVGDGNLQYYLYNWKCPSVPPSDIGLVLQ